MTVDTVTVTITADTRPFWLAMYRIMRWARQPADDNPFPPLSLFRRSNR